MKHDHKYYLMSEAVLPLLKNGKLNEEYVLHLKECPVCSCTEHSYMFKHWGFTYNKCKGCTFVFVNPRINNEACNIWYNSKYYNAAIEKEYYINRNIDYYHSGSLNKKHTDEAIKLIRSQGFLSNINVLDLGCGGGAFLSILKDKLGFQNVLGIDLSDKAVEFAADYRKLNVIKTDANYFSKNQKFDFISSIENIEHVNDINAYMKTVTSLIKEDGYLLISTPHNDQLATKVYGIFGDHYCAPNHLNYFNKKTITLLLKKYGFEICDIFVDTEKNEVHFLKYIKLKFLEPDQVTTLPPYEAYFSKRIWKYTSNRRKAVKVRLINADSISAKSKPTKRKNGVKLFFRELLKGPKFKFKSHTHMIVIAKKI
jgi:2-polyprenyl-3-methyl-5-hydroxy-6-metoxy-1,4-benzoquinol methylase